MNNILGRLIIQVMLVSLFLAGCQKQVIATSTMSPLTPTATGTVSALFTKIPLNTSIATQISQNTPQANQAVITQVMDMNFIDPKQGWLLASTLQNDNIWGIAIRQTVDGGDTWTPLPAPLAQPNFYPTDFRNPNPNLVHQIRFVDGQTGWIFGPGLFFTRDGGKTWQPVSIAGAVVALEQAGKTNPVWAITQSCPQVAECSLQLLETTPDKPDQWTSVSPIPAQHPLLAFLRPEDVTGYLLNNIASDNFQVGLISTQDSGHSWNSYTTPCISEQPLLTASDKLHLYLLCSGIPSAGNQPKQFYTSLDAGESWSQVQNPNTANSLGTFGYSDALLFLAPKDGILGLGRSSLFTTQDGGISWIWSGISNLRDATGWVLAGAGGQEVFAALQTTVYHSLDGGLTWNNTEIH